MLTVSRKSRYRCAASSIEFVRRALHDEFAVA
jgi:hypothetical protein